MATLRSMILKKFKVWQGYKCLNGYLGIMGGLDMDVLGTYCFDKDIHDLFSVLNQGHKRNITWVHFL